jgi:4-amino-4-deoxy-L-arabinose transferase-like glycosyltransferase
MKRNKQVAKHASKQIEPPHQRHMWRAVLLLSLICAITYFTGLAAHGLTNWQEGQRALVAREMQTSGNLIVPTVNGEPYLAKPPMVYWAQLGIARTRAILGGNGEVAVVDLRLAVAIAGWLGVLATFFVGRMLLESGQAGRDAQTNNHPPSDEQQHQHRASRAAFWSAATLATGLLYVRSSRIGELDILIVPFVVIAIGTIFVSWRSHVERGRMHLRATLLATAAASGAMLTKGPPALVCIIAGGYGGIIAWTMLSHTAGPGAKARAIACFRAMSRTHPVAVIGVPFAVLWLWLWAVRTRVGPDAIATAVERQTSENIQFFVLESPLNNLEAMSYGVGLASALALLAAIYLIKHQRNENEPLSMGNWIILAWVVGSFIAFSSMGKGVPRYLTPMWPGIALLGGMWIAKVIENAQRAKPLIRTLATSTAVLAIGQGWWYGLERDVRFGDRTPESFISALLASPDVDANRIGAVDIWDPRLDYYTKAYITPFLDVGPGVSLSGVKPQPIATLPTALKPGEPFTLLIRATPHPSMDRDGEREIDRLRRLGLIVTPIDIAPTFRIDNRKTKVIAVSVTREEAQTGEPD